MPRRIEEEGKMFIVSETRNMNNKRFQQAIEPDTKHMGQEKSHPALATLQIQTKKILF